jgi:tRNA(Arg) A34 adenosine deaminase TadA
MLRRALLVDLPAAAGLGASTLTRAGHAREIGSRSVTFTPAHALTAEERTRHSGEIVCRGVGQQRENPIFHGEIVAINACARVTPKVAWADLALYTTAEPCPMCMSAIVWTRIPELVFGTSIEELIKLGINQIRLDSATVAAAAPFYSGMIVGGVLGERADEVYRDWASRFK